MNISLDIPAAPQDLVFDTTDPAEFEHVLKSEWLAKSFRTAQRPEDFQAVGRKRKLTRLDIAQCGYSGESEVHFDGLPFVRQQFSLAGRTTTKAGRNEFTIDTSSSCILPANVDSTLLFTSGYRQLIVRIAPDILETALTNLIGVLPRGALRFTGTPARGAHFERLRRFMMLMADETGRAETPLLVVRELEDAFLTQFLSANEHNHREKLLATPAQSVPRHVRLIEEYIAANWDKPFTIDDIARVTGVSVRTIYATFKQHRGYGPKTFLRQTRLNRARELLRKSGMDVATVAKICGFSNAGHFARYYRAAFGELPSSTAR
jgi:AraC-like DNA-binding protein